MDQEVRWRVGVLRRGEENIGWTAGGLASTWVTARKETIDAVRELVAVEGRQEYHLQLDEQEGSVNPGLDPDGRVVLGDLERLLPSIRGHLESLG